MGGSSSEVGAPVEAVNIRVERLAAIPTLPSLVSRLSPKYPYSRHVTVDRLRTSKSRPICPAAPDSLPIATSRSAVLQAVGPGAGDAWSEESGRAEGATAACELGDKDAVELVVLPHPASASPTKTRAARLLFTG